MNFYLMYKIANRILLLYIKINNTDVKIATAPQSLKQVEERMFLNYKFNRRETY